MIVNPNIGTSSPASVQMGDIDSHLLSQMMANPAFYNTQSSATVSAATYRLNTKEWNQDMRTVFEQVKNGYADAKSSPVTVNMSPGRWQGAFDALVDEGAIIEK